MSEWIDHAEEARRILSDVKPYQDQHIEVAMGSAQVHATLALVEQQRIANLIALGHLQIASGLDGISSVVGDGSAFRALYPEGPNTPLHSDIARALRIGDGNE